MKNKEMLYIRQNGDCYIDKDCKWGNTNIEDRTKELAKDIGIGFQLSGTTRFGPVAEELVEMGYQRIKKDDIVISREEYEKLKNENKRLFYRNSNLILENKNLKENLDIEVLKASEETAEKFVNLPNSEILTVVYDYEEIKVVKLEKLQEIAEQFGVEIKE